MIICVIGNRNSERQVSPKKLFLKRVEATAGCWVWTGHVQDTGYGRLGVRGLGFPEAYDMAHRVAYRLFRGEIPEGMSVLHRCDNRRCVKPSHLFLGTKGDNNADRAAKGRNADRRGVRNTNSKMNDSMVREIRASPERGADIARRLGVSQASVCMVRGGKTWTHVR